MKSRRIPAGIPRLFLGLGLSALVMIFPGCSGRQTSGEIEAREDLKRMSARYRPGDARPDLPKLSTTSGLKDYLLFALLNHPRIEAAYYEWYAGVEAITVARSLPDPRLTFSADILDNVQALMPGLMVDLPGPGKLERTGAVSAAESRALRKALDLEMLRVAYTLKSVYFRMQFLEDSLKVQHDTLGLLKDLEVLAQQQNAAGRATLQDALGARIEASLLETRINNLEDSRKTLAAEFKASLGLGGHQPNPPVPAAFDASSYPAIHGDLLGIALKRNPDIGKMTEEVNRAQAMIALADRTGVPDFSAGLEADVKNSPWMWTPSVGLTLPLWRDKNAARVAEAKSRENAARARLTAGQVQLAQDLASILYAIRESTRDLSLLEERLLPDGRLALEASRAGYANGKSGFGDVLNNSRQLLNFDLSAIEARTRRELALGSLSLLIADTSAYDTLTGTGSEKENPLPSKEKSP